MVSVTDDSVSVVEVAPGTFVKVFPPSVDTSHCTVGVGLPDAEAVKVAVAVFRTFCDVGSAVTWTEEQLIKVAAVVGTLLPQILLKTARN